MYKRTTQKDIAKALKIGSITVQRAFSNNGYVSPELKKKIFKYAKEIGYTPSRAAQALVKRKTHRITIFSSEEPSYFWEEVRAGTLQAMDQISDFNYTVDFQFIAYGDTSSYIEQIKKAKYENIDAIGIVYQSEYNMEKIISTIENEEIPYVFYNTMENQRKEICYIGPDYEKGGALAADFLGTVIPKKGRLAIINYNAEANSIKSHSRVNIQREKGFINYLKDRYPSLNYGLHSFNETQNDDQKELALRNFFKTYIDDYDGLYYIPSEHGILVKTIDALNLKRKIKIVTHDIYKKMEEYLEQNYINAIVYQSQHLQGYYAVMTLANYIEYGQIPKNRRITIHHSLVMNANKQLYKNHIVLPKFKF